MSKIGKRAIEIPAGVSAKIDGSSCILSSKTGSKTIDIPYFLDCQIDKDIKIVPLRLRDKHMLAMWGTCRALVANAVNGLAKGYEKHLELKGLGYKAEVKGNFLHLVLGYSHVVKYPMPADVKISCSKPTQIDIFGNDKQRVGQVAADIMSLRKHNRYKDYGIHEIGKWRYVKVRKSK